MESDFSVFHRVDDPYALPGPVFVARLGQLMHYRGAVRGRALAELDRQDGKAVSDPSGSAPAGINDPILGPDHASGFPSVFEVSRG